MEAASEKGTPDVIVHQLHTDFSTVVLTFVAPWLCQCVWGFSYSSIALHYRSSGWSLWRLSIIALAGNAARPVLNGAIANVGTWVCAPLAIAASILVCPAVVWPDTEVFVSIQLFVGYFVQLELGLQTVCFSKFAHSQEELKTASRIQSLGFTTGYAMSPFIGGLVYDLLGWRGCAGMHLACQSLLTLGICIIPGFWKDWKRWKTRKQAQVLEPNEKDLSTAHQVQKRKSLRAVRPGKLMSSAFPIALIHTSIRWPCMAVALALGTNAYSYQCEWSTYALYFREEHSWTSAMWAGICQMLGDVIGACVLVVSARLKSSKPPEGQPTGSEQKVRSRCPLFNKPYNLSLLLGAWIVLNIGLTTPSLHLAVASQVLMGTVYVFFMQWVNEMNMLYAFGDSEAYARIRAFSLAFFTTFVAVASGSALLLYENVGRLAPFYVSALCSCLSLVMYTASFFPRAKCTGNLEQIEEAHYKESCTGTSPAPSTCAAALAESPQAPASDSAPVDRTDMIGV